MIYDDYDITRNRHRGNPESIEANERAERSKVTSRAVVLRACQAKRGTTCRELSKRLGVGMNVISGRFSELKAYELIEKIGKRDGCGVYRAKENQE